MAVLPTVLSCAAATEDDPGEGGAGGESGMAGESGTAGDGGGGTGGTGGAGGDPGGGSGGSGGAAGGGTGGTGGAAAECPATPPMLTVTSSFANNATLPRAHTCLAEDLTVQPPTNDVNPRLNWTAGPACVKSYAITLRDQLNNFMYWAAFDIAPNVLAVPQGLPEMRTIATPVALKQLSYGGGNGYRGPCGSSTGSAHTYIYRVHALSVASIPVGDLAAARVQTVIAEIDKYTVARGEILARSTAFKAGD